MEINQAFTILQKSGGTNAARIITRDRKKLPFIWVLWVARQLRRGVPVAKIIHEKWFYALKFYTNKHTLDPRPDSETLVTAVLEEYKDHKSKIKILDLGTGTGCLIASIVKNLPNASGVAIDKSRGALRVARRNIKSLGLDDRVLVTYGDFSRSSSTIHHPFDIIISNPPYIARGDARVNDAALHDPRMALYAKNNGLAAYEMIAWNAKKWLKKNGKIYLEVGAGQTLAVLDIFTNAGWNFIRSYEDLGGIERVLAFSI